MQPAATRKLALVSLLSERFDTPLGTPEEIDPERLTIDIPELDAILGGLARGQVTEVFGPLSSGRATFALRALAAATARQEVCAWVDGGDTLDPASAASAGVDLDRLLWVRCAGHTEHAIQAADLLLHAGGFGAVVLDLATVPDSQTRRIPPLAWFRLRRAVENTPTILLLVSREPLAKQCASALIEMRQRGATWSGGLLSNARLAAASRKPARPAEARWLARAIG